MKQAQLIAIKKQIQKSKSNPNLRIQTVVGVYITCINRARKQRRPTHRLVRRLIKVLEEYPDIVY